MADDRQRDSNDSGLSRRLDRAADWVLANRSNWVRGLLMLAFVFVLGLVKLLVGFMALFQFGALLITGQPNEQVRSFGGSLAVYTGEIVAYLTCATDRAPFPFREWPRPPRPELGL